MSLKVNTYRTVEIPEHTDDFVTRIVTSSYTVLIRLRFCPIVEHWFLNIRNSENIDVGLPIILNHNVSIFTKDEEHGRVRSCMARPDGLPPGIGFVVISDQKLTRRSFKDDSAVLLILEE